MAMEYKFNKYQSPVTEEELDSLPNEIKEQFLDAINNIPYVRKLVSPNRLYARDLPKDDEGKIIVDITNPHILEDSDYFRPTALHYKQFGCFTKYKPNYNPNSDFGKWIREEIRRCWYGYVRPSDGEWITGDMYFFLNYCPIQLIRKGLNNEVIRTIDFPDFFDGNYFRFHYLNQCRKEGHHAMELAKRGAGKSYCAASLLAKRFILGEFEDVRKKVQCVVTASERKYIQGANQVLDMFQYYIDFCADNTEFPSQRITSSIQSLQWTMGYMDVDSGTRKGTLNSVVGLTSNDDDSKLIGSRGVLYLLEEAGKFPHLLSLYQKLRPSVEDGSSVFGLIYGYGTSGEKDSDFSSMQELMYNPEGYNIKGITNIYDKEGQGRKKFTYFYPGYMNRANCYDKDGNSDVIKAILEILKDRYKVKYNSTDINAVTKRTAEIPLTPQEAIQKSRGNIFPITELTQRLNEIDNNPNFYDDVYVGTLITNSKGKVEFSLDTIEKPIRDFPTKDNKVSGALEIYEMPQEVQGKVPNERYIVSLDNYENDDSDTMSLGSLFVLDLWTDRIVAEYTGRPMFIDDLNEFAKKICIFFNAKMMYEAHPYSQIVKTPDGIMLWKDINIGSKLFAPDGGIVTVIDIPVDCNMPIYKVTLEDGREIEASDNHIWLVYESTSLKKQILTTTKKMMEKGVIDKYNRHRFFIPNAGAINYAKQETPIDAYTLGLLLAEGCFANKLCRKENMQISSSEKDMRFYKTVIPYKINRKDKFYNWTIYIKDCKKIMNNMGLWGHKAHTKFIPSIYLYNDYNTRMELLKGLMDGDGCARTKGAKVFMTVSKQLSDDVMTLCRSLGINCKCSLNKITQKNKEYYSYRISIFTEKVIFKLPRKIQDTHIYTPDKKGSKAYSFINRTAIKSIEFSHYGEGKCVTVDSEDGLYLIGDYVITHNCNKKNTFAYFSRTQSLHLLADTPEYLKNKQLIKSIGYGNCSKGISVTAPIKNFGFMLIRDWLLKPVTVTKEENGENISYTIPNLFFLKNRALIKELILYNPDINVDRIMSLIQLMLYREEKMILYQGNIGNKKNRVNPLYLGNDSFFTRNYKSKKTVNLAEKFIRTN